MYEIHVLSVFILNSWFLTILNEMLLGSGPCKRFSGILTVDLDLWMDSLTLDIIFEVENMKCALMKFIEKVCLIIKYRIWHHKIWFLTNFYQMQLISCPYKAFPQIWPLTFICTYWPQIKKILSSKLKLCVWIQVLSVHFILNSWFLTILNQMQLYPVHGRPFFLHFDCWSWPLNGLIDLRWNIWGGIYKVYFNEIYWRSVSHHKIWFLTNLYQMQLISCSYKAFFTDLTFNLYFKMYLLTSDLNFTV